MTILRRLGILRDRLVAVFEEPSVARFVTPVGSSSFTLSDADPLASDRHVRDIEAPGLIGGSLAVLFFRTAHTGTPQYSVRLNATNLTRHALSAAQAGAHAWHELIPAGALRPVANELTFAISEGGTVEFSDIVILYRSNKLTVSREPEVVSAV
ncbi:MAG: hypothetical protein M3321_02835 [Actinomycetota bacterium]|nr:hypothetical protein [Actinomycetota bacterium]